MIAPEHLWIGYLEKNPQQPFSLQINDLYTHLAIMGSSGSGKTVLAKSLIESAIVNDLPCIVIDPQGDLVKLAQLAKNGDSPEDESYRSLYESFSSKVFPVIFTPGTKYGLKGIFNPLASFPDPTKVHVHRGILFDSFVDETKPDVVVISEEDLSLLLGGMADGILGFVPESYLKGRNRPKSRIILFKSLNQAFEAGLLLHSIGDLVEWMQRLAEANFFTESEGRTLTSLIEALKIVTEGPESVFFTDGIPLDPNIFLKAPNGKVPLVIFYLNVLPSLEAKQEFVANLTLLLYSFCLQRGAGNFLYFIDEVRDFIPSGAKQPPSKKILKAFFTQSRKYKVISVVATQSVGSIDYEVLGQCNTRAYGRLTVEQELKKLREFLPPDRLDDLPKKTPGRFLIHTKRGDYHDIIVRRLVTEHGSPVPPQQIPQLLRDHPNVIEHYKRFWTSRQGQQRPETEKADILDDAGSLEVTIESEQRVEDEERLDAGSESHEDVHDIESALPLLKEELVELYADVANLQSFKISWKILDNETLQRVKERRKVDRLKSNVLGGDIYQANEGEQVILFSVWPVTEGYLVVTAFS